MNPMIHPAEHPMLQYADYQVVPESAGDGKPDRFLVQQVVGHDIVCVVGNYATVLEAVAAIEEHAKVRQVELR